jgi:hypothetical protein
MKVGEMVVAQEDGWRKIALSLVDRVKECNGLIYKEEMSRTFFFLDRGEIKCCNQAWLLKNSFLAFQAQNFPL